MIYGLIKFGEYKYMEQMQRGQLYFRPLGDFSKLEMKELEKETPHLRYDIYEGTEKIYSPKHTTVKIGEVTIGPSELAGPVRVAKEESNKIPILCMYAITHKLVENFIKGKQAHVIHNECLKFGDTALIITNIPEFFERIKTSARKLNINVSGDLVKYFNINEYHGDWGPFRKPNEYKYQSEYRIVLGNKKIDSQFILDIGDISDISLILNASELQNKLEIRVKH